MSIAEQQLERAKERPPTLTLGGKFDRRFFRFLKRRGDSYCELFGLFRFLWPLTQLSLSDDPLHRGQITVISQSKPQGKKLVVDDW